MDNTTDKSVQNRSRMSTSGKINSSEVVQDMPVKIVTDTTLAERKLMPAPTAKSTANITSESQPTKTEMLDDVLRNTRTNRVSGRNSVVQKEPRNDVDNKESTMNDKFRPKIYPDTKTSLISHVTLTELKDSKTISDENYDVPMTLWQKKEKILETAIEEVRKEAEAQEAYAKAEEEKPEDTSSLNTRRDEKEVIIIKALEEATTTKYHPSSKSTEKSTQSILPEDQEKITISDKSHASLSGPLSTPSKGKQGTIRDSDVLGSVVGDSKDRKVTVKSYSSEEKRRSWLSIFEKSDDNLQPAWDLEALNKAKTTPIKSAPGEIGPERESAKSSNKTLKTIDETADGKGKPTIPKIDFFRRSIPTDAKITRSLDSEKIKESILIIQKQYEKAEEDKHKDESKDKTEDDGTLESEEGQRYSPDQKPLSVESSIITEGDFYKESSAYLATLSHPKLADTDKIHATPDEPDIEVDDNFAKQFKIPEEYLEFKRRLSRKVRDASTIPFVLYKAFGLNRESKFINLTKSNKHTWLFYACSHAGVLTNYRTGEQKFLLGHKNTIVNIAADEEGSWLVTADKGTENTIIIWNSEFCAPTCTIFEPHKNHGVEKLCLSYDAKYLITVGNEARPIIKFWIWSLGNEECDASYTGKINFGDCKNVACNMNCTHHFMVTFEYQVVFLKWEDETFSGIVPTLKHKKNLGRYTCSTYLSLSNACASVTEGGWVVMWANAVYLPRSPVDDPTTYTNDKVFIKAIKLQTTTITIVTSIHRLYVTGDVKGHVKFYDRKFRILFWFKNYDLDCIRGISFHKYGRKYSYEDTNPIPVPMYKDDKKRLGRSNERMSYYENRAVDCDKLDELLPTDATLHRTPFIVRDFVVMTSNGQLGIINFLTNRFEVIIDKSPTYITSFDVHAHSPILCLGYGDGTVVTYQYLLHEHLMEYNVPHFNAEEAAITCIKFAHQDAYLAVGTASGAFWFLHPTTLEPLMEEPFRFDNEPVINIKFSDQNEYCAYYDTAMGVCIFIFDDISEELVVHWKYVGRVIAHYAPIVDMCFIFMNEKTRLISVGEDRYLVEYDLTLCDEGKVDVVGCACIDQTAIPQCFIYFSENEKGYFLVGDSKYKFKVIGDDYFTCMNTYLAPTFDAPPTKMKMASKGLERSNYLLFLTEKYLGIHALPVDGNPYKYVGLIVHPVEVTDFVMSSDFEYVFTSGRDDHCCLMWRIKLGAVDNMMDKGGKELEPYYCLIEGGVNGWLYREMQDLFYYMQILNQGENSPEPRNITNKIELTELANLMRAVGYYPTEYELMNLMKEAQRGQGDEGAKQNQITFEEFFKLYINHRPAFGISSIDLQAAFIALFPDGVATDIEFVTALCTFGETLTKEKLYACFKVLMHYNIDRTIQKRKTQDDSVSPLPKEITFDIFMNDMLGIDMERAAIIGATKFVTD